MALLQPAGQPSKGDWGRGFGRRRHAPAASVAPEQGGITGGLLAEIALLGCLITDRDCQPPPTRPPASLSRPPVPAEQPLGHPPIAAASNVAAQHPEGDCNQL